MNTGVVEWGRARDDRRHASRPCCGNAHDCRCNVGKTAARDIASRTVTWNKPLSQRHAGIYFRFEGVHAGQLLEGETVNLVLGEPDVFLDLWANVCGSFFNLFFGHDDICSPSVKLLRISPYGHLPVCFDVCENIRNDLADLVLVAALGRGGLFEVDWHGMIVLSAVVWTRASESPASSFTPRHPPWREGAEGWKMLGLTGIGTCCQVLERARAFANWHARRRAAHRPTR